MKKITILLLYSWVFTANAQQWGLDTCFAENGIAVNDLGTNLEYNLSIHLQDDGKILGAGFANNGGPNNFFATRYNPDGSIDEGYGLNGNILIPNGGAEAATIQVDNKLLLSGFFGESLLSSTAFALIRLTSSGSLDTAFGANGFVSTEFGDYEHRGAGVIVQPDGKIVQSGTLSGLDRKFVLMRFEEDGTPDLEFGSDGAVTTEVDEFGQLYTLAMQDDGKLIAAGRLRHSVTMDFVMIRYNSDGAIDSTFGTNGFVFTDTEDDDENVAHIRILSDGKILMTGRIDNPERDFWIIRFNPNGSLDSSFGSDGMTRTDLGHDEFSTLVVPRSNGKIVVAGPVFFSNGEGGIGVVQYDENGLVDMSFGNNGSLITTFDASYPFCWWGQEQPDGKVLISGSLDQAENPPYDRNLLLIRYSTEGCGLTNIIDTDEDVELFNFYPNPAENRLTINCNQRFNMGNTNLSIYDATGNLVSLHPITAEATNLDLTNLKSGLYLLKMKDDSHLSIKKLVVK